MRISDWSSDVCSSDLMRDGRNERIDDREPIFGRLGGERFGQSLAPEVLPVLRTIIGNDVGLVGFDHEALHTGSDAGESIGRQRAVRSEEHTSELQSLMRLSSAVVCLKKKNQPRPYPHLPTYSANRE